MIYNLVDVVLMTIASISGRPHDLPWGIPTHCMHPLTMTGHPDAGRAKPALLQLHRQPPAGRRGSHRKDVSQNQMRGEKSREPQDAKPQDHI